MRNNEKDDDWGDDKSRRTDRYKRRTIKKEKHIPKDMPSRVERNRPRNRHIEWQGRDYDYKEEFGED